MNIVYININGETTNNACISVDMGYLYGYGIFETVKVMEKNLIFINEHFNRLKESLLLIGIKILEPLDKIEKYCMEVIKKNNIVNGAIRLTVAVKEKGYNVVITSRANSYTEEMYKQGFKIAVSDFTRNENGFLVSVKSNNYLENFLLLQKARAEGYDETVFFNNKRYLAEGSMSNIFFIKNKECYTPAEDCGILPGIVRRKIIQLIKSLNFNVMEGKFTANELIGADEVFICNSLMDIMPVKKIGNQQYLIGHDTHTTFLMNEYKNVL